MDKECYRINIDGVKDFFDKKACCQFIYTGDKVYKEVNYFISNLDLNCKKEKAIEWYRIIKKIDKHFVFEECPEGIVFNLNSKNYVNRRIMYLTFILARWVWMYKGLMQKTFDIKKKYPKISWFKCSQLAHSFKYSNVSSNNLMFVAPGIIYSPLSYKEVLAFDSTIPINKRFISKEYKYFNGTIEGIKKASFTYPTDNIYITKEQKEIIDNILLEREDKQVWMALKNVQSPSKEGDLFVEGACPNHYEGLINIHFRMHTTKRNGVYVGWNISNKNIVKIDYNKIKIKE